MHVYECKIHGIGTGGRNSKIPAKAKENKSLVLFVPFHC